MQFICLFFFNNFCFVCNNWKIQKIKGSTGTVDMVDSKDVDPFKNEICSIKCWSNKFHENYTEIKFKILAQRYIIVGIQALYSRGRFFWQKQ